MKRVLVIGEILVDSFIDTLSDTKILKVGGAPFNVAYNLAALGNEVTFIGQVGDDLNGEFILKNIKKLPLLNLKITKLKNIKTTVANVVSNNESVSYYFDRDNTSDYKFDFEKILKLDFSKYDLVHIGSLMLSNDEAFKKLITLLKALKNNDIKVSFDVNLRQDIYKTSDIALERNLKILDYIDVLKTSLGEATWLFKSNDITSIINKVDTSNKYLFITDGSEGAYLLKDNRIYFKEIYKTNSIDFVGCGDSFFSGALHKILSEEIDENVILSFANATGGLTTKVKGALGAYNSEEDVIDFISSYKQEH